ncbi:hypothetical protein HDU67_001849 [Dinochytrium kinnereticum]|nr:hypothetical protein HDU67_001849 [Dinochytrium kinnereticum]
MGNEQLEQKNEARKKSSAFIIRKIPKIKQNSPAVFSFTSPSDARSREEGQAANRMTDTTIVNAAGLAKCPCGTEEERCRRLPAFLFEKLTEPTATRTTPSRVALPAHKCTIKVSILMTDAPEMKEKIQILLFSISKREPELTKPLDDSRVTVAREVICKHLENNSKAMFVKTAVTSSLMLSMRATMSQKFTKAEGGAIIIAKDLPTAGPDDVTMVKSGTFERRVEYDIDEAGHFLAAGSRWKPKVDFNSLAKSSAAAHKSISSMTPDGAGKKRKSDKAFGSYTSKAAKINSLEFRKSLPPMRSLPTASTDSAKSSPSSASSPKPAAREAALEDLTPAAKKARNETLQEKEKAPSSPALAPNATGASKPPTPKPSANNLATPLARSSTPKPTSNGVNDSSSSKKSAAPSAEPQSRKTTEDSTTSTTALEAQLRKEMREQSDSLRREIDDLKKLVMDLKTANQRLPARLNHTPSSSDPMDLVVAAPPPRQWASDANSSWPVTANPSATESAILATVLRERDTALLMTQEAKEFAEAAISKALESVAAREKIEEDLKRVERERDAAVSGRRKEEEEGGRLKAKVRVMSQIIKNYAGGAAGGANGGTVTASEV